MRADGQGERIRYYEVELENVLIGSVNQSVHEGDILQDSVSLKFSKVRWKYTQQSAGWPGGVLPAAGISPPTVSHNKAIMGVIVQPKDPRGYFMLPRRLQMLAIMYMAHRATAQRNSLRLSC
jgi:hypothetical protein